MVLSEELKHLPKKGRPKLKLKLTEKGKYDFELGKSRVKNLTRHHHKRGYDFFEDMVLSKATCPGETQNRSHQSENGSITNNNQSESGSIPFSQTLNLDIDCLMNDFPYTPTQSQPPALPDKEIFEEEKQIYSNLDDLIEKKRQEAFAKLNKSRERKVEINHLMALYRLDLKRSRDNSNGKTSIFLTQEQIKLIHHKKALALQKLHERTSTTATFSSLGGQNEH